MDIAKFKKLPVMGILRGIKSEAIEPLTETVIACGLKTIEIAMNTPDAGRLLGQTIKKAKGNLTIGAGTVLTMNDLKLALDSGATFIVLPTYERQIVEYCVKNKIPVFPGAFSPQEIYNVWRGGATMVKVFPAKFFGATYFKEIKGPLADIELLACGGVNADNIGSFFSKGASAIAFGSSIFKNEWIERKDFWRIEECLRQLLTAYEKSKDINS